MGGGECGFGVGVGGGGRGWKDWVWGVEVGNVVVLCGKYVCKLMMRRVCVVVASTFLFFKGVLSGRLSCPRKAMTVRCKR